MDIGGKSDVTFEVKETAEIQKVSMKDEQAVRVKIVVRKLTKQPESRSRVLYLSKQEI